MIVANEKIRGVRIIHVDGWRWWCEDCDWSSADLVSEADARDGLADHVETCHRSQGGKGR